MKSANSANSNRSTFVTILSPIIMFVILLGVPVAQGSASEKNVSPPRDMAYVPFGQFVMGIDREPAAAAAPKQATRTAWERRMSMPWSAEAFYDEGPAHIVALDAYFIDKYEVSNKEYGAFIQATGHPAPAYWDDPRVNKPNHPVVGVNWYDAKTFCEWKGKRLPTEAEWEKAARGPEGFMYPWGNSVDPQKATYGKRQKATAPVDSYPEGASSYGLHHMAGNVFEWVNDWYDPNFYSKTHAVANPTGPRKAIWLGGTGTYVDRLTVGEKRVVRGGSWIAAESSITATHRFWNHPMNNSYGIGLGFRCAMPAPAKIEQEVREAYISALVSMGAQRYTEARAHIQKALKLDPSNKELLQVRDLIEGSRKKKS